MSKMNKYGIDWNVVDCRPEPEKMVLGLFRDGTMSTCIWENGDIEAQDSIFGVDIWDELDYEPDDYIDEGFYMVNPSSDHPIPFYASMDMIGWVMIGDYVGYGDGVQL